MPPVPLYCYRCTRLSSGGRCGCSLLFPAEHRICARFPAQVWKSITAPIAICLSQARLSRPALDHGGASTHRSKLLPANAAVLTDRCRRNSVPSRGAASGAMTIEMESLSSLRPEHQLGNWICLGDHLWQWCRVNLHREITVARFAQRILETPPGNKNLESTI